MLRCNILLITAVVASGCHFDDLTVYRNGGAPAGAPTTTQTPDDGAKALDSAEAIFAFLDEKALVMGAETVPSHPNGYDENVNFGQATQCIHQVTMAIAARSFQVITLMATLEDAPRPDDVGMCDREKPDGQALSFNTTAALIENVAADGACFDITLTYAGFGQEGRGAISADRETIWFELFFRDQATGHRCADGAVGDPTVTLNQVPFAGDAVQVYAVN